MVTVNESITTGSDDGSSTIFTGSPFSQVLTQNYIRAGYFTGGEGSFSRVAGFRFQTINIPQGATVSSATFGSTNDTPAGSPNVTMYGDDVDDAPGWSTSSRIFNITKTTASASVTTASGAQTTDVTSIVQEIVDRGGWSSNNDMRFGAFDQVGSGNNVWYARAYELGSGFATLDITFTTGDTGANEIIMMVN